MKSIVKIAAAAVALAFLAVDASEACCRKPKPPPPPKCPSDTGGSTDSVGGGSMQVTFSPLSGGGQTYASNGMPLPQGQRCLCSVAVKKTPGVAATGVTFPAGYPAFAPSGNAARVAGAKAFVDHFLTKAGKNPADFDVFVFETDGNGGSIPGGVDFNLSVQFAIPQGSTGSELTQDITSVGMFLADGDDVQIEPTGQATRPLTLDEYQADETKGNLLKAKITTGSGLRMLTPDALTIANQVCLHGGFNCDVNRDGLVDVTDLRLLTGTVDAAAAPSATACPTPADPVPREPTHQIPQHGPVVLPN
jgi:hypothetical protein